MLQYYLSNLPKYEANILKIYNKYECCAEKVVNLQEFHMHVMCVYIKKDKIFGTDFAVSKMLDYNIYRIFLKYRTWTK